MMKANCLVFLFIWVTAYHLSDSSCFANQARRESAFLNKLSNDVLVYITLPNVKITQERWQRNDLKHAWDDDLAAKDFAKVGAVLGSFAEQLVKSYPISLPEMLESPGGEISFAAIPGSDGQLIWIVCADVSGDSLGAEIVVSEYLENKVREGGTKSELQLDNGVLVHSYKGKGANGFSYFLHEDTLVFADDSHQVDRIAKNWYKTSRDDSLAADVEFVSSRNQTEDSDLEIFVRVEDLLVRQRENLAGAPLNASPLMMLNNPLNWIYMSVQISTATDSLVFDLKVQPLVRKGYETLGKSPRAFFGSAVESVPYEATNYTEIHKDFFSIIDEWWLRNLVSPLLGNTSRESTSNALANYFPGNVAVGFLENWNFWFCMPIGDDVEPVDGLLAVVSQLSKFNGLNVSEKQSGSVSYFLAVNSTQDRKLAFGIANSVFAISTDEKLWESFVGKPYESLEHSITFKVVADRIKKDIGTESIIACYFDLSSMLEREAEMGAKNPQASSLARNFGIDDWSKILSAVSKSIGPAGIVVSVHDSQIKARGFVCKRK